jgi:hypothetical protein
MKHFIDMNPPVFVSAQVRGSDLDKNTGYRKVFFYDFLELLQACTTERTGVIVTF